MLWGVLQGVLSVLWLREARGRGHSRMHLWHTSRGVHLEAPQRVRDKMAV